jgi:hypothetical protein
MRQVPRPYHTQLPKTNYVLTRYNVESEPNKVQLEFGKDVSQCAVLNISRHVRIEDTRLFCYRAGHEAHARRVVGKEVTQQTERTYSGTERGAEMNL